jgi:hypothetical protein
MAMKKTLIALVLLAMFALAGMYLFIPGKIELKTSVTLNAAQAGVYRTLLSDSSWSKWWPGEIPFYYNKQTYSVSGKIFNSFDIDIAQNTDTLNSRMDLILTTIDSVAIAWYGQQVTSRNPFKRMAEYRAAKATEKNIKTILQKMKTFFERQENVYGFKVKKTIVSDSVLISTRRNFDHHPTVEDIYAMIQRLRRYIVQNKAIEKNLPMLNVQKVDSSHYQAMTAIAVDRWLPQTNEFVPKLLLKGGTILETEIKGGEHTIENAFKEFENYRLDYRYTSPAIPYQLMITDRMTERDTTKWITKLYYPVL